MKRKTLPIVLGSFFLGLLFDLLFYGKVPGISFFLFVLLTLLTTLALTNHFKKSLPTSVLALMAGSLFFSAMVFVRANEFLTLLNICVTLFLLLLSLNLVVSPDHRLRSYAFRHYVEPMLVLPFAVFGEFFGLVRKALMGRKDSPRSKQKVAPIVRGILLSLPFIFIFLLLFSSADLVFKKYVGSLFDLKLSPEFFSHTILIGFITSLFLGAYALLFLSSNKDVTPTVNVDKSSLGTTEAYIILGSVGTLFAIFVVIQIAYLFGGQGHIASTGITYAEYARKGFFELIAVALISLALVLGLNASTLPISRQRQAYKWLNGLLILEVFVIMLSATRRLGLYEQAYGFTSLRLFSHLFIGLLMVIFVCLAVHIFKEQRQSQFTFRVFLSVIGFLAVLNLINPDAMIAKQNIERFNKTGKIDIEYLGLLSADATQQISRLLDDKNEAVRLTVGHELEGRQHLEIYRSNDWQSYNVARNRAKQIFKDRVTALKADPAYHEHILQLNK